MDHLTSMKRQLSNLTLVAGYAVVAGFWFYLDQLQIDFSPVAYELFHGTVATAVFLAVTVAIGFFAQWSSLIGLIGPLSVLIWLQVSGYKSPWQDGTAPLLTLRTVVLFAFLLVLLLLGIGLRRVAQRFGRLEHVAASTDDRR